MSGVKGGSVATAPWTQTPPVARWMPGSIEEPSSCPSALYFQNFDILNVFRGIIRVTKHFLFCM